MNILLGLILVCACGILYLLYEVIKQQGRLLLRLDGIEQRLGMRAPAGAPAQPAGLAVGTAFAPFKLPDLTGKEVALEDFRGRQVLLINWSPQCGFCARIAQELAGLREAFQQHKIELVLAAHGDAEANRKLAEENGLNATILLQKDTQTVAAFQGLGTPVAYLLDEEGRVAKPLAVGADKVPALAREAVGYSAETERAIPSAQAVPTSGPGTELKKLLARFGMQTTPDCPCNDRVILMDRNGCDWCAQNIDTIIGWLREEANRRGLVFIEPAARVLVRRAITKARHAENGARKHSDNLIREGGWL
ncbi:MAG: TlpA disulfide reductase family protein [Candidatus Competibacteraceae bacterium]